jgi:hypothetical protein
MSVQPGEKADPHGRRRRLGIAALIVAIGLLGPSGTSASGATRIGEICPHKTNEATRGTPLKAPVALSPTPQSAQKLVNFGTGRQFKIIKYVTVTSDKMMPRTLKPDQISFEAILTRTGESLETAEFPEPTFSSPTISQDRRSISFNVCLNPEGISAGKYVGLITVSGPPGLGATSINLTVNAKDGQLFTFSWIIALLSAFVLLLLKDAKAPVANLSRWRQLLEPLTDPIWLATTVVALAVAFGALYKIYASDPAWGSNGFTNVLALVGAAAAAVGGQAILTTLGVKTK